MVTASWCSAGGGDTTSPIAVGSGVWPSLVASRRPRLGCGHFIKARSAQLIRLRAICCTRGRPRLQPP
ncbi:unnamed protein product [Protopolystoma xenopodis]|uniref:Uncharacterized protein n=1 Tax=Protopolystoma xenopodis TaxID=117903 RepID=A0A3S5AKF2_9PLAT|nr:unnamed protein product [Protopolystoma xenopodis]